MTKRTLKLKKSRLAIILTVSIVIVLLAVLGCLWWINRINTDPTVVWYKALDKSLQLSSYKSEISEIKRGKDWYEFSTSEITNASKLNHERASGHIKFKDAFLNTEYDVIGTAKTEYMRFQRARASSETIVYELAPSVVNKWVKGYVGRKELVHTPKGHWGRLTRSHFGLSIQPAGLLPMGNLEPATRDKIINYAKQINLYGDVSKPQKEQVEGREVYVYSFRFDGTKTELFYNYVHKTTGRKIPKLSKEERKKERAHYKTRSYHVTVDLNTGYITRMLFDTDRKDYPKDVRYSNFNQPVSITFPKPELTPKEFNDGFLITGLQTGL